MATRKLLEQRRAVGGECDAHAGCVVGVAMALDESRRLGAVDQPDHAVVLQQQRLGELAHRWAVLIGRGADGQRQLKLHRGGAGVARCVLSPGEVAAKPRAKLGQPAVVVIGHNYIVVRYRSTTCCVSANLAVPRT